MPVVVGSLNNTVALSLLGQSSGTSFGVDSSLMTAWAAAKAGIGATVPTPGKDPNAPLAPVWQPGISPSAAALVQRAYDGKSFFDTEAKLYSDLGAVGDYKRLFALHSGVSTLQALAGKMEEEGLSSSEKKTIQKQFDRGLAELQSFFGKQVFEDVRLAQGDRLDAQQTTLAIPRTTEDYTTPPIHKGGVSTVIQGLDKNAKFEVVALSAGGTERRVEIDLADMGSIPRTFSNVISFLNNEMAAAGAATRFAAVDKTPKTATIVLGGRTIEQPYKGAKMHALKVDVRAGETVSFEPVAPKPAFYVVGNVSGGARLVKLEDVAGTAGQPVLLDRPGATADPIGANVATGWMGPSGVYGGASANAFETRTNSLVSDGENNFEAKLRVAGEATLKLMLADGRSISVSTAWRAGDLETWRARVGENGDQAMIDDISERLTQLLHEQGVAAGVDVWENGAEGGFSIFTGDHISVSSLTIGGKATTLSAGDDPASGYVGGLRAGVSSRAFEISNAIPNTQMFKEDVDFVFTSAAGTKKFTIDGGSSGVSAAELTWRLNDKLKENGILASASVIDDGASFDIRFETLHDTIGISATINEAAKTAVGVAPAASVLGGLPLSSSGEPFGDGVRTINLTNGSPLSTYTGAVDLEIVVATPTGNKTINVSVSALERAADPDTAPGEWSAAFQARLDAALNDAGVYAGALGNDLNQWAFAEEASHRITSIKINGDTLAFTAQDAGGLGGAFGVERSFTSAQAATGVSDDVTSLLADQNVSITFGTAWGQKTVSATLEPGDPRTLESAALRLNEALAAQGYDLGVEATALSGGGAGLRLVTGASHSVRNVEALTLGGVNVATTLDPIDSQSYVDDNGGLRVAVRAERGGAVVETIPSLNTQVAGGISAAGWFPGRSFDVAIGGDAKVGAARAVQAGPDGSVYVLADLSGDSATTPIKGARDVALLKYDSAGALQFSRILGAADTANGYALAVSADGKVAVAGSVQGGLPGGGADKGGLDSFVAVYDANGAEQWVARRGAKANDQINAIAFAPDGGVIVVGKTESALGSQIALGGTDGYVRGFNASGLESFTKQFGTTGADTTTALAVRDNGAGGIDIFTGGVESGRGVLRSFSYAAGTGLSNVTTSRDVGTFSKGGITSIALDGANLYIGGETGVDRVTIGGAVRGAVSGQEGFIARLSTNLGSTALDRTTYIGTAGDDSVTGLAVIGGEVYATGAQGAPLAGQGLAGKSGFLAKLDANGQLDWTKSFNSSAGVLAPTGLAYDASGASPLDVLGLPQGPLKPHDSGAMVGRSALRAGDEFSIGVLGRRATTITVAANETMASLLTKVNRALGSGGRAELVRDEQGDRIKITAKNDNALRIDSGRSGRDALGGLGLTAGVIASNTKAKGQIRTFGLGLVGSDLKLTDKTTIAKTKAELSAAISIVRQAYEAIANPNAKELTAEEQALEARRTAAGVNTSMYSAQLANYKAALARLGG